MKAKVISRFQDRESGVIYKVGETYSGSPERISELVKAGVVEKPKKASKK